MIRSTVLYAHILIFLILCIVISTKEHHLYEIKHFEVPIDHFNFANTQTFKLRYLYNDSFVDTTNNQTPLFFYTGNEGNIELFAQNTGFLWDLASQFKAYVVFAEHRYYGKSLPFGDASFNSTDNFGYLSVEQTLEDFVDLIQYLRGNSSIPVVTFGGSYGGMLSFWLRIKYPYHVQGALAASAPVWQFNGLTPCDIYAKITTSVFTSSYSANCSENLKKSWNVFRNFSITEDGRKQINSIFKFCDPLQKDDINNFFDYLQDVYGNLAMANYPYENDFLSPLPAYPVRQFCQFLSELHEDINLLNAMQKALNVYTNYTGTTKCLDYKSAYAPSLGGLAWDIQTCNEIVMPMCSFANETMFPDNEWNFKDYSDKCYNKFKIRPKLNDIILRYGGKNLKFAENIIFSNGLLDPWSGGGVLRTVNNKITVIIIPEGAHHLDLRSANPADPPSVREARKHEAKIIRQWIMDFFETKT